MEPMANVRELALLSLDAAQQIDMQLGGGDADDAVLKQFGAELTRLSGVGDPQVQQAFLSSDPTTTEIFAQAAGEVATEEIFDIDALTGFMNEIVGPLMQSSQKLPNEVLCAIRSFSLAFHRALLANQFSGSQDDDSMVGHEFRAT
jgi:hypothetical protein